MRKKTDFSDTFPRFFASCSPIVADGLCIVQVGGEDKGGIAAYDLASGDEKWKWTGDGTAYASPVLLTVDDLKVVVAETAKNIVGIGMADGKLLWETPFQCGEGVTTPPRRSWMGRPSLFRAAPRHAGREDRKRGGYTGAKELWANQETSVQFSTPVVKNGLLFGLSGLHFLFCINAKSGKTAWTHRLRGRRGYGSVQWMSAPCCWF